MSFDDLNQVSSVAIDAALATKIVRSGGFTFIAECVPDPDKSRVQLEADARWRCQRIDADGNVLYADGEGGFNNVATNIEALSYK